MVLLPACMHAHLLAARRTRLPACLPAGLQMCAPLPARMLTCQS